MTKKEMITIIRSANSRIYRMKKAGYTKSETYQNVMAEVAKSRKESPFAQKHTTLSYKGKTVKHLQASLKAAKVIMKTEHFTVGSVKKEIQSKRANTLQTEYGLSKWKATKAFYNLLNSSVFKKTSELFSSDQVMKIVVEAKNQGQSNKFIENNLTSFLENKNNDRYYIDDLEKIMKI